MNHHGISSLRIARLAAVLFLIAPAVRAEEPSVEAVSRFNSYIASVEARLAQQHRSTAFLARVSDPKIEERLKRGELVIEKLTPAAEASFSGAMLHDWRGTAFAPHVTTADFDRLLRDFNSYPKVYAPQVVSTRVLAQNGDNYQIMMRVRQKHVITVVMDTVYNVAFSRVDAGKGFSTSRSTRIAEVSSPGTAHERELSGSEEHGFLWRLNTYWTYEERDGGLYMQIESVSLTRSIPTGLGWVIRPFVESVPRDSLEFTLKATRDALQK